MDEIVLDEYLNTSIFYYPLDNINFLNDFKKPFILNECGLSIDSIIDIYSVKEQYHNKAISDLKVKSIYLDALEKCYSGDDLVINIVHEFKLSDWASAIINQYYPFESQLVIASEPYSKDFIAGWPFVIRNFSSTKDINDYYNLNSEDCKKYLKISPTFKTMNYHFMELANGCGRSGENKYLYVLILNQ